MPSKCTYGTKLNKSVAIHNVAGDYNKPKWSLTNLVWENFCSLATKLGYNAYAYYTYLAKWG